ncbi:MAG: SDR family NAD(P)-dependent oxidoreductase, partial [Halobacteriovoraceae bacterium]|nr:SDR family NAD(P)-dependent oxidoreductase [Halobacteriovoraceae bacterium]
MDLNGKQVLITGANRGIGLGLAKAINEKGAIVFLGMRNPDSFNTGEQNFAHPENAKPIKIDLGSRETIESFLEENKDKEWDILVNNAGQLTGGLLENQETDDIYSMYQVNLVGLTHLTQKILPGMIKRGRGKIVNNASVSGVMHLPCASTYAAAKTAVVALTNSLTLELEGTGVSTLTLITPGIKTRMFDQITDLYGDHVDLSLLSSITTD